MRRPFLALALAATVAAGWLGTSVLVPPTRSVVDTRPSQAATGSANAAPIAGSSSAGAPSADPTIAPSPGATPRARATPSATAVASVPPSPAGTPGATAIPLSPSIASATPLLRAALDARFEVLRAKAGIPGISASILFADGSLWQGTAGLADVATGRPVTPDTAFAIASVSKTFTAALILRLVDDGRLGLDKPVTSYLPALRIDRAITVRQLLDHTSGLRDFYFNARIDKALLTQPASVWDAARSLSYVGKPFAKPGTSWHYSNTNYLILGMLAEAVGGGTVAHQLRQRFLTPLGLDHTYYQSVEAPRGPVAHSYRFAGTSLKQRAIDLSDGTDVIPFTSVVTSSGAAGSIATTSGDLVHWAHALYQGSALDVASRAEMVVDALRTAVAQPTVAYGLGVQVVPVDGLLTLGHSGRFLGARASVRWIPAAQVAIAVLTDQSRSDPGAIVADLLRLIRQPAPVCLGCPPTR